MVPVRRLLARSSTSRDESEFDDDVDDDTSSAGMVPTNRFSLRFSVRRDFNRPNSGGRVAVRSEEDNSIDVTVSLSDTSQSMPSHMHTYYIFEVCVCKEGGGYEERYDMS